MCFVCMFCELFACLCICVCECTVKIHHSYNLYKAYSPILCQGYIPGDYERTHKNIESNSLPAGLSEKSNIWDLKSLKQTG